MNWKTLVVSAVLSSSAIVGCGTPAAMCTPRAEVCGNNIDENCNGMADDVCPMAVTRTYVVSTIDTGETNADMTKAFGFDLDHMVGGTTGRPCTAAPDFHSITTNAEGVDNQLSTVLPLLGMMLMGGVNGAIQQQIQGGTLLLMFEVSEINDFTTDPAVMVHIVLGQVPAPGMVMTAGMGIAPGQTFTTMMDIATVPGTITAGRLSATTTMLPLSFMAMGAAVTLTLRDVVVGGNISAMGGFTNGEFGAVVAVTDVVTLAGMFIAGVDVALIESVAMPDLMPDATGAHCASISAGLGFTTVAATLN